MSAAMQRARDVIAEALWNSWADETERMPWAEAQRVELKHVEGAYRDADAILAALVERMGLREYLAYRAASPKRRYWLETKASDWQEDEG